MRVAYVTMQFPAPAETFATTDVRTLRSFGVHVDVYTLKPAHDHHMRLLHERGLADLTVRSMTVGRALRGLASLLWPRRATVRWLAWVLRHTWRRPRHLVKCCALIPGAMAIAADLRREGYDVVHLFWGHFPALVGKLVRLQRSSPQLTMFLGAYDLQEGFGPSRALAQRADAVVTHARANLAAIAGMGVAPESVHVIYRGVPLAEVDRGRPESEAARHPRRLLVVARLIPSKRVDAAIRAFGQLASRWPDAALAILGDGPSRSALMVLVEALGLNDRVEFHGHVPHHEVLARMWAAAGFVLLSTKDGERLPNVVKEAMACGCVPVVAVTPGIEELVEDGVTGWIVPASSHDVVADRVERVLRGGPEIEAMRAAGRRVIERRFDARRSMQAYVSVWRDDDCLHSCARPNELS